MKKMNTVMLTRMSMGICLNVLGAWIAATFRIPIYMDSIGTVFILGIYGPKAAILTGMLGSLVSGVTFDYYSLYYMPAQIFTALTISWIIRQDHFQRYLWLAGLPTALVSAIITAILFGGITSSSSTFFVILFNKAGLSLTLSVFLSQVIFDCLDKAFAILLNRHFFHIIAKKENIYAKI